MTWADYVIVFVCLASGAFGFWRGFMKEVISVATWLGAIWVAWRFAWAVEPMLGEWITAPDLKIWAARVLIFVVIVVAGGLIAWLARALIRHTGLSSTDRTLGGLFGAARGVLIVGLAVIAMDLAGIDENPWWQSAKLRPFGDRVAAGIRYYAELGGSYLQERELVRGPGRG